MSRSRLPKSLRHASVAVLALALAGCEEVVIPEIPGEPGEAPAFTIVQIETLAPTSGTNFSVSSGPHAFDVRIFYQRSATDVAAQPTWPAFVWAETWRGPVGNASWQGDVGSDFALITDDRGDLTLSGTFALPRISPFCGSYDRLRAISVVAAPSANLGQSQIPRSGLSVKEDLSSNFAVENYVVTGAPTLTDPCVIDMESVVEFDDFAFFWGEPVWIWGSRLPAANPVIRFAGGEEIDFTLSMPGDSAFGSWDLVQTWIPSRAQSGAIRVLYDGTETDYGGDSRPQIVIGDEFDYFEPNDHWEDASTDPIDWGDDIGWAINPGLTIDDIDQLEDSTFNPFDATGWGVGDWWVFDIPSLSCVQIFVFMEQGDDLDLILADGVNRILATDLSVGGTVAMLRDLLILPPGGLRYTRRLWVAPWSVTSEFSRYKLWILNCDFLSSPEAVAALEGQVASGPVGQPTEWNAETLRQAKQRAIEAAVRNAVSPAVDGTALLEALEGLRPTRISPERRLEAERHWAESPGVPTLFSLSGSQAVAGGPGGAFDRPVRR